MFCQLNNWHVVKQNYNQFLHHFYNSCQIQYGATLTKVYLMCKENVYYKYDFTQSVNVTFLENI